MPATSTSKFRKNRIVADEKDNEPTTAESSDAATPEGPGAPPEVTGAAGPEQVQVDAPVDTEPSETPASTAPSSAADAGPDKAPREPEVQLGPKERRAQKRASRQRPARAQMTVEERAAERAKTRRAKATQRRKRRLLAKADRRERAAGGVSVGGTPPADRVPGVPRVRRGTVVSDKADKTITVQIQNIESHRVYKKVVRTTSKLHAHDATNDANIGDVVQVVECRPMSATKRWRLSEIVERAR